MKSSCFDLVPRVSLPLERPPEIIVAMIGVHGHEVGRTLSYRYQNRWCIHLYEYSGEIEIGSWHGKITPGMLSLIPPQTRLVHRWNQRRSRHFFAHFQLPGHATFVREVPALTPTPEPALRTAIETCVLTHPKCQAEATAALWAALWTLVRAGESQHSPGPVALANDFILQNLPEKISLHAVAEAAGISINHLNRLFKMETGETVAACWRRQRAGLAERLLRNGGMRVKEVAHQCGYPDLQSFNKALRHFTGVSPREVRQSGREGRA